MSMIKRKPLKYNDGRTKQAFKDACDINKILKRAQKTGTISHMAKHGAHYGDYAAFDFHEAQNQLARAREIFDDLPSEIRREFNQDPGEFFRFANDPENVDRLDSLLPELAKPGTQAPDVNRTQPRTPQAPVEAAKTAPQGEPVTEPTKEPVT